MMDTLKIIQTSTLILLTLGITASQTTAQHNVEISGKMTFDNGLQNYGVHGLRVYLFFVDIEGTGEPELLFTDHDIEGKTFDLLDEGGTLNLILPIPAI